MFSKIAPEQNKYFPLFHFQWRTCHSSSFSELSVSSCNPEWIGGVKMSGLWKLGYLLLDLLLIFQDQVLAVCFRSLPCCRVNWGPIKHIPDGIVYGLEIKQEDKVALIVPLLHRYLFWMPDKKNKIKKLKLTERHWVQTQWRGWGQSCGCPCGCAPQWWGSGRGSAGGCDGRLEVAGADLSHLTKSHYHRTLQTHSEHQDRSKVGVQPILNSKLFILPVIGDMYI